MRPSGARAASVRPGVMPSSSLWLAVGAGLALLAAPVAACSPPFTPRPPALPGESDAAYTARIEAQTRRDAEAVRVPLETAQRAREDELWRTSGRILVAEVKGVSGWRRDKRGAEYRIITLRATTTARGTRGTTRLQLRSYDGGDACFGPQGPIYPSEGKLVMFAREGRLSDATVLGWSDVRLSTHPETLALLARASAPSQ